jgi:hypothetical protein
MDTSREQSGSQCGYIAARAVADIRGQEVLYGHLEKWMVRRGPCVDADFDDIVIRGNNVLEKHKGKREACTDGGVTNDEVLRLLTAWAGEVTPEVQGPPCCRCGKNDHASCDCKVLKDPEKQSPSFVEVSSLDCAVISMARFVVAEAGRRDAGRSVVKYWVVSDAFSNGRGTHWICVAVKARRVSSTELPR